MHYIFDVASCCKQDHPSSSWDVVPCFALSDLLRGLHIPFEAGDVLVPGTSKLLISVKLHDSRIKTQFSTTVDANGDFETTQNS